MGTHSPWASRLLAEMGHEVLVADARKLRAIYANEMKSDSVDAQMLARIARLDPRLLSPIRHRGRTFQVDLAVALKLAVLLHRLWVTGEVYEPLRGAPPGHNAQRAVA